MIGKNTQPATAGQPPAFANKIKTPSAPSSPAVVAPMAAVANVAPALSGAAEVQTSKFVPPLAVEDGADYPPNDPSPEVMNRWERIQRYRRNVSIDDEVSAEATRSELKKEIARLRAETEQREKQLAYDADAVKAAREYEAQNPTPPTWEKIHSAPRYRTNDSWFFTPALTAELVRYGKLESLVKTTLSKTKGADDAWCVASEARAKIGSAAVRIKLRGIFLENAAAAQSGELEKIKPLPDQSAIENEFSSQRTGFREAMRSANETCAPFIAELADRLQETARQMADEIEQRELAEAQKFGFGNVEPSGLVKKMAQSGLHLKQFIVSGFAPMIRPHDYIMESIFDPDKKP